MRAVVYTGAGGNEVVSVEQRPDPVPHGDELLVAVRYAGINPADLQQRDGHYPPPPGAPTDVPGLEVAGTVIACGERVLRLSAGDRVFGLVAGGGLADRVVVSESAVCRVPDALDEQQAAAVPEGFITAHDSIRSQAGLRPGEVLVVSGASGGVGSAAVQIGAAMGARVIGTSRSESGRALIESLGGVGVHPADVPDAVAAMSGGSGADVVLELAGAPWIERDLSILAMHGRIMVVGVGAGRHAELDLRTLMARRGRILASTLRARPSEEKALAVRAFAKEVLPALAAGRIAPIVDRIFPLGAVAQAFDHVESGPKAGKVLLEMAP